MKHSEHIVETILERFAQELPWGVYLIEKPSDEMRQYGCRKTDRFMLTENYLAATIRDVCAMTCDYKRPYTETSPSGLVYIALPVSFGEDIKCVLATYLSMGREGTWRRSLNRGLSVSQAMDILHDLSDLLKTCYQLRLWFGTTTADSIESNYLVKGVMPEITGPLVFCRNV